MQIVKSCVCRFTIISVNIIKKYSDVKLKSYLICHIDTSFRRQVKFVTTIILCPVDCENTFSIGFLVSCDITSSSSFFGTLFVIDYETLIVFAQVEKFNCVLERNITWFKITRIFMIKR